MVDQIPTTTVNITTSDRMKQGQNYKINKKIWELIEEQNKNQEHESNENSEENSEENTELFLKSFFDELTSENFGVNLNDLGNNEFLIEIIVDRALIFVEKDVDGKIIGGLYTIYSHILEGSFNDTDNFSLNIYENNTLIKENILKEYGGETTHNIDIHLKPVSYKAQCSDEYKLIEVKLSADQQNYTFIPMENNSYLLPQIQYLLIVPSEAEVNSIESLQSLNSGGMVIFEEILTPSGIPDTSHIMIESLELQGNPWTYEISNDTIIFSTIEMPETLKIGFDRELNAFPMTDGGIDYNTLIPYTNGYYEISTEGRTGIHLEISGGAYNEISFYEILKNKTPDSNGIYQYRYSDFTWNK